MPPRGAVAWWGKQPRVWMYCQSLMRLLLSVCKMGRVVIKEATHCQAVGTLSSWWEAFMSTVERWSLPAMLIFLWVCQREERAVIFCCA